MSKRKKRGRGFPSIKSLSIIYKELKWANASDADIREVVNALEIDPQWGTHGVCHKLLARDLSRSMMEDKT